MKKYNICYRKQLDAAEKYLNLKENAKYTSTSKCIFLIIVFFISIVTFIILMVPLPK